MPQSILAALRESCPADAMAWLEDNFASIANDFVQRRFFFAFSGASRHFDRRTLVDGVPSDQLARRVLLLALAAQPRDVFLETLEKLLGSADIRESVVIFSSFSRLPHTEKLLPHAREATRTNVVDIFDAIALDNPFPRDHFPEEAWNQLVLKCLFINRPLHRVLGIEDRANPTLAKQVSDLAHERWAAGRQLNPEAWRCCQDFLDDEPILSDLRSLAARSDDERRALALVYAHNERNAEKLASVRPSIDPYLKEIESGQLTWESVGGAPEI